MTAINAIRTSREVLIFTDGAEYDRDFRVTRFRSKMFVSPHLPLLMTSQGPVGPVEALASELESRATSFADVVRWFRSPMALEMAEQLRARTMADPLNGVRIVIAGIEDGAPALYTLEPLRSIELVPQKVLLAPWHDDLPPVVTFEGENRLVRDMVELMEYQRNHCRANGNSIVGGFVEMTSITPDRISRRIVHRWPDRVGEAIAAQQMAAA